MASNQQNRRFSKRQLMYVRGCPPTFQNLPLGCASVGLISRTIQKGPPFRTKVLTSSTCNFRCSFRRLTNQVTAFITKEILLTFGVLQILRGNDKAKTLPWFSLQLHIEPFQGSNPFVFSYFQSWIGFCDSTGVILQTCTDPVFGLHGQGDRNGLQEAGALDQRRTRGGGGWRSAEWRTWNR